MKNSEKGFSIASLVLGIVSIVLFWVPGLNALTFVCGVVGLILALNARKAAKAANVPMGLATVGMILSIIGICLSGLFLMLCTLCGSCSICGNSCSVAEMIDGMGDFGGLEDIINEIY